MKDKYLKAKFFTILACLCVLFTGFTMIVCIACKKPISIFFGALSWFLCSLFYIRYNSEENE